MVNRDRSGMGIASPALPGPVANLNDKPSGRDVGREQPTIWGGQANRR
jgi:hypothetical protein